MSTLGTDELQRLVDDLAGAPERWADLVRHDAAERVCVPLHRDDEVEVWLICWQPGHDTGFHDHDESGAAVTVVRGEVVEERLSFAGVVGRTLVAGETLTVPHRGIHRVRHSGSGLAVTLHAYSPPLREMGAYVPGEAGDLRRIPVAEGEALAA